MHKGTIRAYNGDGGAVFEITLPPGGQINADVVHQVQGLKRHSFFREAHRSATIRYRWRKGSACENGSRAVGQWDLAAPLSEAAFPQSMWLGQPWGWR